MKMIKYIGCFLLLATALYLNSCTKEDDFKKFVAGGEITYPARVDTVIVQPGYKRIQLRIALSSDASINRVKVYWNSRIDSTELNVVRTGSRDTVNVLISNLKEGVYNFEVFTYNKNNNSSVVRNASGNVYGDNYVNSLSNRVIKSVTLSPIGEVVINWEAALTGETGIELKYVDYAGINKVYIVPIDEMTTRLPSFEDGSTLSFRSLFKPGNTAIDVFTVDYSSITLPVFERQLAKSNFKVVILPTDVLEGGYQWYMEFLWNENYGTPGFATKNSTNQWFTFDMGESVKLSRFKIWQANDRFYNLENTKRFEVWGSNNPDPDGSWDSWTKLTTCVSVKPSGLPLGQTNSADVAFATAGEEFLFPQNVPKTRFIRIKVLETWGNKSFITISELSFWTHDR